MSEKEKEILIGLGCTFASGIVLGLGFDLGLASLIVPGAVLTLIFALFTCSRLDDF